MREVGKREKAFIRLDAAILFVREPDDAVVWATETDGAGKGMKGGCHSLANER